MPSDLKRVLITAALATAAFNATAFAPHAPTPLPVAETSQFAAQFRADDLKPRRVRIERCGSGQDSEFELNRVVTI